MYTQEITRCHHAAIVIAIDQSCSMADRLYINGIELSKAEMVSLVAGRLIDELLLRSRRDDGYRNYYDIAVIGYRGEEVYPLLSKSIGFIPVVSLADRDVAKRTFPMRYNMPKGEQSLFFEDISIWVEPRAEGATPMLKMLTTVYKLVHKWCSEPQNRDSFPPIVCNITDDEASDGTAEQLIEAAELIRNIGTEDGNTLFVNVHLSPNGATQSAIFPRPNEMVAESRHAQTLAKMSSTLPDSFEWYAAKCRKDYAAPPFLAMSYNASISELIAMLNIGTRSLPPTL